jgi:heterotetrameric sarcosine oxidase delta subunit
MILIRCPWCGERDHTEFTYLGDATSRRPEGPAGKPTPAWIDYVYMRDNPKGAHVEYWHHHAGCRQWIKVARDTVTHAVAATDLADKPLKP